MAAAPPLAPVDSPAPVPLADLRPGERATVAWVDASPLGRRLLDLGFAPGTPLRVLRRAPLGDPTTYELRGMRLCLRRGEARAIWVARTGGGSGGDEGR